MTKSLNISMNRIILTLITTICLMSINTAVNATSLSTANINQLPVINLTKLVSNASLMSGNNTRLLSAYNTYHFQLKNLLRPSYQQITDDQLKLIFASFLSYQLKPYGTANASNLSDFMNSTYANCATYPIATYRIYLLLHPQNQMRINFVGWNNGAVGNHAQLFVDSKIPLLIDPTIGLVAIASFNQVASGKPINPQNIVSIFKLKTLDPTSLPAFNKMVINALVMGQYKPSDLLYYFNTYQAYTSQKAVCTADWATPQISKLQKILKC
ncbi:MAG: hypothetical protein ACK4PR_07470 [Gammaproteobacteria bacterium]